MLYNINAKMSINKRCVTLINRNHIICNLSIIRIHVIYEVARSRNASKVILIHNEISLYLDKSYMNLLLINHTFTKSLHIFTKFLQLSSYRIIENINHPKFKQ